MKVKQTKSYTRVGVVRCAAVVAIAVAVAGIAACTPSNSKSTATTGGNVALLMSDNNTYRWFGIDVPNIKKALHKYAPSAKVLSYNGDSSPDRQLAQARTAIGQGAKVLVVVSVDPVAVASIVKLAHQSGVKVIAYEHQITKAPTDYYVGFNPASVGNQEGKWVKANTKKGDGILLINGWTATSISHVFKAGYMKYLGPLFKSGERKLLGEYWTPQWLADKAQAETEAFLTKGKVPAVILCENDQMAGGVVAALKGAGLAGKVKVTGLDSDLAALQRILSGTQSMTIHPEYVPEAVATAKISAAILAGETPPKSVVGNKMTPNGVGGRLPWVVVPTEAITKTNMGLVIKEGYVTKKQLCSKSVPKVSVCK